MNIESRALKVGELVKIVSRPKEGPHPLESHIGRVVKVNKVKKNRAGDVVDKTYDIAFGWSSVREVSTKVLYPRD